MTTYITEEGSRMNDYDFKQCVGYAPFNINEVEDIIACSPGEADGPSWHYIVVLKNRKFGYVTGNCDYSGWDCYAGGEGFVTETLEEAINKAEGDKLRKNLLEQALHKKPYGLRE